jgi:hypothetical protein
MNEVWLEISGNFVIISSANNITNKEKEEGSMNYDLLIRARHVLDPLWKVAWLKRCTERNFSLCVGNELISVSQQEGRLVINEFQIKKTTGTKLGKEVRELFQKTRLMPQRTREIVSRSGNTWCCSACGKRGEFDPGLLAEVDSRGEGARDIIRKIDKDHRESSPGCVSPKIEVFDVNMVRQEQLTKLLALERVK